MTEPRHRRPSRTEHRAALPSGPVSVDRASALGWTPDARRHAVRAGELERLQRGVVRPVDVIPPETPERVRQEVANLDRARAAALECSRATISHLAASIAHGMPTFGDLDRGCVTVPSGTALRKLARVHLHRATLPATDIVLLDGYRVTSPARTVFDVAREFGVEAGVVVADFALHTGLVTLAELRAAFEVCRTWPGRKAARITLLSADGDAESPLESVSRLRMAALRLPAPRLQVEICDLDGRFLGRPDFYWDEFGVFGEADGIMKYTEGLTTLAKERTRQGLLEGTGLIGVRWGWPELFQFESVARRLEVAYARGARPGSAQRRWGLLLPPGLHP